MLRTQHTQCSACIRCNSVDATAAMLPLFSTRAADEEAALFIHAVCAQGFAAQQLEAVAKRIGEVRSATAPGAIDLDTQRALRSLETSVSASLQTLIGANWSP
jgi:hypothetical protein